MHPLFSIVIPTYNRADLIMETLNTVFEQSYTHYEIIVVDNKSTDNTAELLQSLHESGKIKYIIHDQNYERGRSRNTGMIHAKGDFLTFLDSDDFMKEDCLQSAAEYIMKYPDIKVFQNKYDLVDNQRQLVYQYTFPSLENQYKALASGNFISCIANFIHRDIYTEVRFNEDPKMVGSEDYEVWFDVLAKHKMGRIEEVNSSIREHPKRSVHTGVYQNLQYQKEYILKKIKHDGVLFDKFGAYLGRLEASFLLQESITLRQLNKRGQAFVYFGKAIIADFSIIQTRRFYGVLYNLIK